MNKETKEEKSSYEKLRDDLIDTKVDVKAWIRSIKIVAASATILLAVLAFFGYNKIESIEKTIIDKANIRLSKADEMLSKIDEKKLNEINRRLSEKEREFEQTLKNFEKVLSKNRELEEKLLSSLVSNERVATPKKDVSVLASPEDKFQIRQFPLTFKKNSSQNIFLTFSDNFDLKNAEILEVAILQKKSEDQYTQYADYFFKVQQKLNKLSFVVDIAPGNYLLRAGYVVKTKNKIDKNEYTFYSYEYSVKIQ